LSARRGFAPAVHAQGEGLVDSPLTEQQANQAAADAANAGKIAVDHKPSTDDAYNSIMIKIMSLFAWLLGVAMVTLDYAVYYTVVTMGDWVNNLSAVGTTWKVLRDIGNIMLIFGFLAVGITTILNVDWYGGGKKMLPMMIVAAVFLNFSLFISEAIVDTGNLFATQFYTQIKGGSLPSSSYLGNTSLLNQITQDGVSNKIMSQLGLTTLYGNAREGKGQELLTGASPFFIGFMGIILFIIAAFVMFSLAFVLIARFVYLIFLIILAPVGFAGLAIPMLKKRADQWWSKLFEQTITAPVLLLMLYIALAVIIDPLFLTVSGGSPDWTGSLTDNLSGFAGMLLSFLVAMGLLIAVVIQSKNLSAFGAAGATKLAGKLTFGAAAWGVNRTLGRGAYFASRGLRQSKTFNKINAMTGRVVTGTLDRAAKASFDIRGATIGGGLKGIGVDAGEAQKEGFIGAHTRNIKAHEDEAKRIEEAHKETLKNTPEDFEAIAKAEENRKNAEAAKKVAQTKKDVAQTEKQKAETRRLEDKAELDRLAAIDKADRDSRRPSSVGSALREARQKFGTSDANFTAATNNLTRAANALKVAAEEETRAEKAKNVAEGAAETRMKESIKANKIAYAEGIDYPLNPITFVAYGPGTAAAARKIKNSLKEKPTKDKFLETAKKLAKELEDAEGKEKTGDEEGEAPKPEAKPAEGAK